MGDARDLSADGAVSEDADPLRYEVVHGRERGGVVAPDLGSVPGAVGSLPGEEKWEMVVQREEGHEYVFGDLWPV